LFFFIDLGQLKRHRNYHENSFLAKYDPKMPACLTVNGEKRQVPENGAGNY
jgi:hypothetical protein